MGIPLPALSIRPPEQPDLLGEAGKAMQLKSLMGGQHLQQLQTQEAQINLDNARQLQLENKTIRDAYRNSGGDLEKTISAAAASGNVSPGTLTKLQEQHLKIQTDLATKDEKTLKNTLDSGNLFAGALDAVKLVPLENRQQAVKTQLARLASQGVDVSSVAQTIQGLPDLSDDTLDGVEASLLGHNKSVEQEMKRREVTATESKNKREADEFAAKMPGGALQPVDQKELSDWLAKNPGKGASDFAKWKASLAPTANFNLQMQAGGGLTKEALDQQAENYYNTGKLPPGGRGAAGIAQNRAIMNRAAELHAGQSLAAGSAEYKANAASLKGLQETFDNVSAFENTAGKNLDLFLKQAKRISDAGAKFLNTPIRMVTRDMLGTGDMAAFDAARTTALTEIAKVLNSPKGSGVLSDSARNEAEGLIGKNATLDGIIKAANVLKQDMSNRHDSYAEQIETIKGRLGGKSQGVGALPQGNGKAIDKATAQQFYKAAGNDPDKARKLAADNGWKIQ